MGLVEPRAHCTEYLIPVEMQYPAPGVAIQTYYLPQLNYTQTDTFYQDTLHAELMNSFRTRQHVVLGRLDSLSTRLDFDSNWYQGQLVNVDTGREQSLWITVLHQFKGSLPATRLFYVDTSLNYYGDTALKILEETYAGLLDTPFVAFFDDSLPADFVGDDGIRKSDCSFFEPQAFMVIGGRIHKRGAEYYRMPGVSISLDRFLAGAAAASVPGFTRLDTASARLRFGYGHAKVRRVSPEGGRP